MADSVDIVCGTGKVSSLHFNIGLCVYEEQFGETKNRNIQIILIIITNTATIRHIITFSPKIPATTRCSVDSVFALVPHSVVVIDRNSEDIVHNCGFGDSPIGLYSHCARVRTYSI